MEKQKFHVRMVAILILLLNVVVMLRQEPIPIKLQQDSYLAVIPDINIGTPPHFVAVGTDLIVDDFLWQDPSTIAVLNYGSLYWIDLYSNQVIKRLDAPESDGYFYRLRPVAGSDLIGFVSINLEDYHIYDPSSGKIATFHNIIYNDEVIKSQIENWYITPAAFPGEENCTQ